MTDLKACERAEAFTRGPWHVDDDLRQGMGWNRHIVDASGDNRICFMSNTGERPEGFANAHLIAASPDLYEALSEARRALTKIKDGNDIEWVSVLQDIAREPLAKIDAALAKASRNTRHP